MVWAHLFGPIEPTIATQMPSQSLHRGRSVYPAYIYLLPHRNMYRVCNSSYNHAQTTVVYTAYSSRCKTSEWTMVVSLPKMLASSDQLQVIALRVAQTQYTMACKCFWLSISATRSHMRSTTDHHLLRLCQFPESFAF